jgi:hypothetical protein
MSTRDIRTYQTHTSCDVCGRTLLRGEHADVYVNGGTRRSVCELCTGRALLEGWVREGTLPALAGADSGPTRRRSLFGRLRGRGGREGPVRTPSQRSLDDALADAGWGHEQFAAVDPAPASSAAAGQRTSAVRGRGSEPRHVHAVPSSDDHKIAAAIDHFNASPHPRTVAGVARSLGAPGVAARPDPDHPTRVRIVVFWELCWYRYEVDLADDGAAVRVDGQGYELEELSDLERIPLAFADESGRLSLV